MLYTVLNYSQKANSKGSHGVCIRTAHNFKDDYVDLS